MLERGSFVVPYFLDDVRLTKPILTYWGVLGGYAAFGINELGARFVGALMAMASMLAVLYAVWCVRGRKAGLLCACVLAGTPQFLFLARQATPDVYLLTSLGCGLIFLALSLTGSRDNRTWHLAIASSCLALAVLAKGPIVVGGIVGGTLLGYGATRPEAWSLLRTERRSETLRLVLGLLVAGTAFSFLSATAFLFGTSSRWWWRSAVGREVVAALRDRLLAGIAATRLDVILLVLVALGCAVVAVRSVRREGLKDRAVLRTGAVALLAVLSLVTLLTADRPGRILGASLLGMASAAWVMAGVAARFLRQPWLWPRLQPELRRFARDLLVLVAIFVAVAGPWHAAIVIEQGSGYFTDFIVKHNVERAAENVSRGGSAGFYLDVLAYGYFPWSCLLPIGIASLVRLRKPDALKRHAFELFLATASLVTFVAFSSAATKFSHYLAPALIPLAVLLGLTFRSMLDRRGLAARLSWIVATALYLPLMLELTPPSGIENLVASFTVKWDVPSNVAPGALFSTILWAIAVLWLLPVLPRLRRAGIAVAVGALLLGGYLTTTFVPALSRDKSVKALCEAWERDREPGEPIGLYGDVKFGLYFYTDRQIERLADEDALLEFLRPERPAMIVVQRNRITRAHRAYRERYPGHLLHMVEPSHATYATLANHPLIGD
jgi:4-amino-4-deoxy-L-arabinose transferase-like glycosyltransferase